MKKIVTIIISLFLLSNTSTSLLAQETQPEGPEDAAFSYTTTCLTMNCLNTSVNGYSAPQWIFDVEGAADTIWTDNANYEFPGPGTYLVELSVYTPLGTIASTTKEVTVDDCNTVTSLSSTEDFEEPIKAYPNPATDHIHFVVQEPQSGMTLNIYSLLGEQIDQLTKLEGESTLYLSDYAPGIYFYHLIGNDGNVVEMDRFIVR